MISSLPNDWKVTNACGKTRTKRDIMRCTYGVHKEADIILHFQFAILKNYPPAVEKVSQFDTMLVGSIEYDRTIWRHQVLNSIFEENLTEPLQHPTSVYLIHNEIQKHFVTLVVDRKKFYFYDSLKSITSSTYSVSSIVKKIYKALITWYGDNPGITKPVINFKTSLQGKQAKNSFTRGRLELWHAHALGCTFNYLSREEARNQLYHGARVCAIKSSPTL